MFLSTLRAHFYIPTWYIPSALKFCSRFRGQLSDSITHTQMLQALFVVFFSPIVLFEENLAFVSSGPVPGSLSAVA